MVVFTGQWCWGKKKMKNGETGPATSKKRRKKEKKKEKGKCEERKEREWSLRVRVWV